MRISIFVLCLIFSGCMGTSTFHLRDGQETVQTLSITKQKQKIALLQKKLKISERGLKFAQDEVEQLQTDLHQSQLSLIASQIAKSEEKLHAGASYGISMLQEDKTSLFLKERELLQQMMESGPSPEAFEAQVVLDRILRMITEFQDVDE